MTKKSERSMKSGAFRYINSVKKSLKAEVTMVAVIIATRDGDVYYESGADEHINATDVAQYLEGVAVRVRTKEPETTPVN